MVILIVALFSVLCIPNWLALYEPMNWNITYMALIGCVIWWYLVLKKSQVVYQDYNTFVLNMQTLKEKRKIILEKFFKEVDAYKEYEKSVLIQIAESTPMTNWLQTRYPSQIESASLLRNALKELKSVEDNINSYAREADRRKMHLFEMKTDLFFGLCVHPKIRTLLRDSDYFTANLDKTNTTSL